MKTTSYALIAAGALALAGCSSVKTKVDSGPIHASSFSFINTGSREMPAYAEKQKQVHAMVQEAITKNLAAKGVKFVNQGGDLIVAYLIIVGNNATTTSLDEYFGYTADATALADKVHNEQAVKGSDRSYFEAGTLVIDVLDASGSKLLKRSTVQAPILRGLTPEARQERIQGFVDQALNDLRISH